ncbi:hypothetical protein ANN_00451 [Periplaneta americana]|uniref:NF-X1-type domain-containing protein n=1 Tax=Periplaneta americana TaxID=6978 RepID=A0ABQ8TT83_PERAM|nr:hypothetical protein ANN_00451 [Periplaneta americana]
MYIMGNMENLTRSSDIWPKIEETLIDQHAVGRELELRCQVHPDQVRTVSSAADFQAIPEGGCELLCGVLLKCGHICQSICHANDREHNNYKCLVEPCDIVMCDLGHRCKKKCFEDCGKCIVPVLRHLPCGHIKELGCSIDYENYKCQELVEKELPACKHSIPVLCFKDAAKVSCIVPCDARLDECGHVCRRQCHVTEDPDHLEYLCHQPCPRKNALCSQDHPCTKKCHEECGLCEMKVWKVLPQCGHKFEMHCSKQPETFECKKKCERTMKCGHPCRKKCSEKCGDCAVVVKKNIPGCGHQIDLRCCVEPEQKMCEMKCERLLKCGHKCTSKCGEKCTTENCKKMVTSTIKAACGHTVKVPCSKVTGGVIPTPDELLTYCNSPCGMELKCGHVCSGSCSKCLQGRVHAPCKEKCGRTLVCGHRVQHRKLPSICSYWVEGKPQKKPQPGNLPRPGIKPGPPGFAARRTDHYSTGVDMKCFMVGEIVIRKQELDFRGHNESVESDNIGNYIEYLSSLSEFDHLLANHLESSTVFRGNSPAIQNDLIFAISGVMIKNIKPFVAIVVDETSYCSNQSQLSTVLRYVDNTANVQERFIGFTNVSSDKTAATLFQHVEGVTAEYNVDNKLIAQTYDGASFMAGNINGLKTKVQEKYPQALFVHCYSHVLNLVLQQTTSSIPECRIFFKTLSGLAAFFSSSPKRSENSRNL